MRRIGSLAAFFCREMRFSMCGDSQCRMTKSVQRMSSAQQCFGSD